MGLNVVRTIPSLIWALLAVALVGPNPLAGVIGLTFYSVGYLGKFFSEAFESLDFEVARGLRLLGADRIQAFQFGLWPAVRPIVASHALWMFEYNIRSASIIGYVGAGGIGLQLLRYQEFGQWDRFATVLLCILGIVIALDALSSWLRAHLAQGHDTSA
jgi:phosphonate transport system permease protein